MERGQQRTQELGSEVPGLGLAPLTSYSVNLGKSLNFPRLGFLICKRGVLRATRPSYQGISNPDWGCKAQGPPVPLDGHEMAIVVIFLVCLILALRPALPLARVKNEGESGWEMGAG